MGVADLTPAQLDIARAVAVNSYEEAARILGMTPRNVRYHTQQIIKKLEVTRKSEIANALLRENEL